MADAPVVHIGENSQEEVAYKLMRDIARTEGKSIHSANNDTGREWIISTYRECLKVVRNPFLTD